MLEATIWISLLQLCIIFFILFFIIIQFTHCNEFCLNYFCLLKIILKATTKGTVQMSFKWAASF